MINILHGYDISTEELQAYLSTLTVPAFKVKVINNGGVYDIMLDDKLLYHSEPAVTVSDEIKRLTDNWYIEQAQRHFADRVIVEPQPAPDPIPIDNDIVMLEGIAANYEQTLLLQDSVTALMEGLADLYELSLGG